eukprot:6173979-Pleurochrysis_carterae.AAC.1
MCHAYVLGAASPLPILLKLPGGFVTTLQPFCLDVLGFRALFRDSVCLFRLDAPEAAALLRAAAAAVPLLAAAALTAIHTGSVRAACHTLSLTFRVFVASPRVNSLLWTAADPLLDGVTEGSMYICCVGFFTMS